MTEKVMVMMLMVIWWMLVMTVVGIRMMKRIA